jgi:hypothetical protein
MRFSTSVKVSGKLLRIHLAFILCLQCYGQANVHIHSDVAVNLSSESESILGRAKRLHERGNEMEVCSSQYILA